jgi:hypothetical protein
MVHPLESPLEAEPHFKEIMELMAPTEAAEEAAVLLPQDNKEAQLLEIILALQLVVLVALVRPQI